MKKMDKEQAVDEIKLFFTQWLLASHLEKDTFLSYRAADYVKAKIVDLNDGKAVVLQHGKEETAIGLPFYIGRSHTELEKDQYFLNTPLLLMYIAGQWDKENQVHPIHGSYSEHYFKDKMKAFLPQVLDMRKVL